MMNVNIAKGRLSVLGRVQPVTDELMQGLSSLPRTTSY